MKAKNGTIHGAVDILSYINLNQEHRATQIELEVIRGHLVPRHQYVKGSFII